MKKVVNRTGVPQAIIDEGRRRIIPYNKLIYLISDEAFGKFGELFVNIPFNEAEINHFKEVEKSKIVEKEKSEQQKQDLRAKDEVDKIFNLFSDQKISKDEDIDDKKYDILYTYHFSSAEKEKSLKRLRASIDSIKDQAVNICICNTSRFCIKKHFQDLGRFKYVHKYLKNGFCKPKTINFGVKQLVNTKYFLLSDIDLIYQKNYINEIKKKYINKDNKYRVLTYNYNLGYEIFSSEVEEHLKYIYVKDPRRTHYGISPGNGLVYLSSFYIVRGFDETFDKYGAEDSEFNKRISMINKYIEDEDVSIRTFHIYHSRGEINEENYLKYRKTVDRIDNDFKTKKFDISYDLKKIQANLDKENWGCL